MSPSPDPVEAVPAGWLAGWLGTFVRACTVGVSAFSKTATVSGPGSVNQCLFQYTEPDVCRPIGLFIFTYF